MTYTTPATPVAGTAITVSFYGTNIRDNIAHLRALLPDSGGTNRLLQSSSATVATWTATPTLTDQMSITKSNTITSTAYSTAPLLVQSSGGTNYAMIGFNRIGGGEAAALYFGGGNFNYVTNAGIIGTFWSNQNDGTGSGLEADVLRGFTPGNSSGQIAVNNGTVNVNLNADLLDGLNTGNGSGQIPINNGTLNTNLNADLLDGLSSAAFALAGSGAVAGTYTGNGVTSNRLIAVAFQPKFALITGGNGTSSIEVINCHSTSGCARQLNSGNVDFSGGVKLDPNGVLVGAGSNHGNVSGVGYSYVAFP